LGVLGKEAGSSDEAKFDIQSAKFKKKDCYELNKVASSLMTIALIFDSAFLLEDIILLLLYF
jgi:hypothetical protein